MATARQKKDDIRWGKDEEISRQKVVAVKVFYETHGKACSSYRSVTSFSLVLLCYVSVALSYLSTCAAVFASATVLVPLRILYKAT